MVTMVKKSAGLEFSKTRAWARGRCAGLLITAGLLTSLPACSFIVDSNANQCETNADCAGRPGGATTCNAEKLCVVETAAAECQTNQDCINADPNTICRKSDFTCVPVRTPECSTVEGDLSRDDSFVIGSVLPLTGGDDAFGLPVDFAVKLAIEDIKKLLKGIPTATPGVTRPILYIGCDDQSDLSETYDTHVRAALHLAKDLEVPAIIGEAFSGSTIAIAQGATISEGTLLISPAATSDAITTLIDDNLVWRTSPPDTLQAAALKLYSPEIEVKVRDDFVNNGMSIQSPVKIAIVYNNDDSYGTGLAKAITSDTPTPALVINGKPITHAENMQYYSSKPYPDGDDNKQLEVAKELASGFQPHIVMLFGFSETISIITAIENDWGGGPIRPRYILPDAVLGGDLTKAVNAAPNKDSLRQRISGTVPGTLNDLFQQWVNSYTFRWGADAAAYPATTFGAAGGYDAVFLLAYASATLGSTPETGKNLAEGLKKLSMGEPIVSGADSLSAGFTAIQKSGGLDFQGISGPLNFDSTTGEAQSDIQIWCLPQDMAGNAKDGVFSGLYYDAATGTLKTDPETAPCN